MTADSKKKNKTACVTGGTGYVASMLIKQLLERGYTVHATVRDSGVTKKITHVVMLQSVGVLKLFDADLTVEGSFDEAVDGCDYVFHVAIPGGLIAEEKSIKLAVEGTLNVLRSCVKAKSRVKRVVCTSSGAAVSVNQLEGPGIIVDEDSWSDAEFLNTEKPPTWCYLSAKTMAEKEAWKFAEEHNLDLVTVNPVLVVGPGLTPEPPLSVRVALACLTGDEVSVSSLKMMQMLSGSISIVHVEDVCEAHIFVAETEACSGRYILSKINTSIRELAGFLHKRYPQYYRPINLDDAPGNSKLILSSDKIRKAGFRFQHEKLEQIYDEIVEHGKATGLLPKVSASLD